MMYSFEGCVRKYFDIRFYFSSRSRIFLFDHIISFFSLFTTRLKIHVVYNTFIIVRLHWLFLREYMNLVEPRFSIFLTIPPSEKNFINRFVHNECDAKNPSVPSAIQQAYMCPSCRGRVIGTHDSSGTIATQNVPATEVSSLASSTAHNLARNCTGGNMMVHHPSPSVSSVSAASSSQTNRSSSVYSNDENDEDILNDILKSE